MPPNPAAQHLVSVRAKQKHRAARIHGAACPPRRQTGPDRPWRLGLNPAPANHGRPSIGKRHHPHNRHRISGRGLSGRFAVMYRFGRCRRRSGHVTDIVETTRLTQSHRPGRHRLLGMHRDALVRGAAVLRCLVRPTTGSGPSEPVTTFGRKFMARMRAGSRAVRPELPNTEGHRAQGSAGRVREVFAHCAKVERGLL